jgi:hypothetical protein
MDFPRGPKRLALNDLHRHPCREGRQAAAAAAGLTAAQRLATIGGDNSCRHGPGGGMKHLAQVNIGRVLGGPDDPRMADFYGNLAKVNALAERMPGFVWRLKDETGDSAIGLRWPGDATMNVNMSVWESPEALGAFVFNTVHRNIYARKDEFFEPPEAPTVVLWWIEAGHIPTLEEAKARLDRYVAEGPGEDAFGWADLPAAKAWLERRCA